MQKKGFLFVGLNESKVKIEENATISGVCVLVAQCKLPARSIRVRLSGQARVSWSQGLRDQLREERRLVTDVECEVWSSDLGEIEPGTHTFPFNLSLPHGLPPSFDDDGAAIGSVGSIVISSSNGGLPKTYQADRSFVKYSVKVDVMAAESAASNEETASESTASTTSTSTLFSASALVTLVACPTLSELQAGVVSGSAEKTFLFSKNPTKATVYLPYSGNVLQKRGLYMRITVQTGSRSVDSVKLFLSGRISLNARRSGAEEIVQFSRTSSLTTGTVPSSSIAANSEWTQDAILPVPSTVAPSIDFDLIQVQYTLRVEITGGIMSPPLCVEMPVKIFSCDNVVGIDEIAKWGTANANDEEDEEDSEEDDAIEEEGEEEQQDSAAEDSE